MQYRLKRQMSLNLPQPVMDALIAEAEKQDRSRSYVAERAIRAYLKLGDTSPGDARPAEALPGRLPETRGTPPGDE